MRSEDSRKAIALLRTGIFVLVFALVVLVPPGERVALGQEDLFIYPKNGQSEDQKRKDRYECHMWAVQETGFDPTQVQAPPQSQGPDGRALRGAAGGAALGAVGGAIAGDAGKGAAIGAGVGGLAGAMRHARQMEVLAEQEKQWETNQSNQRSRYNRALSSCLEGRGYTVK